MAKEVWLLGLCSFDVGSRAVSVRVWTWVKAVREGSLELELSSQEPPLNVKKDHRNAPRHSQWTLIYSVTPVFSL